jgi:predicted transcriptional regulator
MTDAQQKFLEISKRYETLKEEMKALKPTLLELMTDIGVDTMFQDSDTDLVYKIVVPTGTFITFDTIAYNRTKKVGEDKGSLSKKDAEAAGFTLSK